MQLFERFLIKLIILGKKHKESGLEFSRAGKIVILDDDLSTIEVTGHAIESFIYVLRKLLYNAENAFKKGEYS